jgi:uncharacterized protein (DUF2236 family)
VTTSPPAGRSPSDEWQRPPEMPTGAVGLFGPESKSWRLLRENAISVLGGARALILQVAHPLVGAGVTEHSNYREDPWGRLFRTLEATATIVFGTAEEAETAARQVWRIHGRVRGELPADAGRYQAGTPYEARDPELLMWVHATLVDTALLVYDRYVAPLSLSDRAAYYEEQKLFAAMFGVPRELLPETYTDFARYFDHVVEQELAVTAALQDVVDATLLNPTLPVPARPLRRPVAAAVNLQAAATLPPRLREELGLECGPLRLRLAGLSESLVRSVLPLVPGPLREYPKARVAERRLRAL